MANKIGSPEYNDNTLTITINIVKAEIRESIVNGRIPSQDDKVKKMISKLSKEDIPKINIFIGKLEISNDSKNELLNLTKDLEKLSYYDGFENLKSDFNEHERMKTLLIITDIYFDKKFIEKGLIGPKFNNKEIDAIKLVLFSKLQDNLSGTSPIGMLMKGVSSKFESFIQNVIPSSKNENGDDKDNFDGLMAMMESISEGVYKTDSSDGINPIEALSTLIDPSIELLIEEKTKNGSNIDFSSTSIILTTLSGEGEEDFSIKSNKIIFEDIKQESIELAKTLKEGGDTIKKGFDIIDKLPLNLGSTVKDFLKNMIKDFPILGFVLGLFLGQDVLNGFMDGSDNKKQSAINNLVNYSKESSSLTEGKSEIFKDMKQETLKQFFKVMDEKKIDYTKENFWEELFTGVSDNAQIKVVYDMLMIGKEEGTDIFSEDDFKDNGKIFLEKLNNIKKIEKEQKLVENTNKEQEIKDELALLTGGSIVVVTTEFSGDNQNDNGIKQLENTSNSNIDKNLIQNTQDVTEFSEETKVKIAELTKQAQLLELERTLDSIVTLPATIKYKGQEIILDIESNKFIKIGNSKFNISLKADTLFGKIEAYKGIKLENGNIVLLHSGGANILETSQLKDVFIQLTANNEYTFNIPEENNSSKTKAVLNIKKLV